MMRRCTDAGRSTAHHGRGLRADAGAVLLGAEDERSPARTSIAYPPSISRPIRISSIIVDVWYCIPFARYL